MSEKKGEALQEDSGHREFTEKHKETLKFARECRADLGCLGPVKPRTRGGANTAQAESSKAPEPEVAYIEIWQYEFDGYEEHCRLSCTPTRLRYFYAEGENAATSAVVAYWRAQNGKTFWPRRVRHATEYEETPETYRGPNRGSRRQKLTEEARADFIKFIADPPQGVIDQFSSHSEPEHELGPPAELTVSRIEIAPEAEPLKCEADCPTCEAERRAQEEKKARDKNRETVAEKRRRYWPYV